MYLHSLNITCYQFVLTQNLAFSFALASQFSKFKSNFIQKSSKKKAKRTGPRIARANLGGPELQMFKDKINIVTVITIKDTTNRI